ncbi:MAG: O-antigen ligase family protein [Bacteroidaceae bacterium]|nr:O-antigen ligase family protein [Bacteroidaceae bacterium]
MKKLLIKLNAVDLLASALLLVFIITWLNHRTDVSFHKIQSIAMYTLLYVVFRLTYTKAEYYFRERIILITLAACAIWQSIYAIIQVTGIYESKNYLFTMTGSFHNPGPFGGFLAICASMFIPGIQGEKNRFLKILYSMATILCIILLPATLSRTSLLAFGTSMLIYISSYKYFRDIIKRYWILVLLAISILGSCAYLYKKDSADGRAFINKISGLAIKENGIKGNGLGKFSVTYGETQANYFAPYIDDIIHGDSPGKIERERMIADCPEYAFNEYMEIGVECGIIGITLFVTLTITAIIFLYKSKSTGCYGLIALSIFAIFSYPFKMVVFCIFEALFIAMAGAKQNKSGNTLIPVYITAGLAVIILATGYGKIRKIQKAEKMLENSIVLYDLKHYEPFIEDCSSFKDDLLHNYKFLFALGQSLNKCGEYEKSDSVLNIGSSVSCDPMFWNIMGNNATALGDYERAKECYTKAFCMIPNRLYPLSLLAKLYHENGDTTAFLHLSNAINSFVPKVESALTKELREEINLIIHESYLQKPAPTPARY